MHQWKTLIKEINENQPTVKLPAKEANVNEAFDFFKTVADRESTKETSLVFHQMDDFRKTKKITQTTSWFQWLK